MSPTFRHTTPYGFPDFIIIVRGLNLNYLTIFTRIVWRCPISVIINRAHFFVIISVTDLVRPNWIRFFEIDNGNDLLKGVPVCIINNDHYYYIFRTVSIWADKIINTKFVTKISDNLKFFTFEHLTRVLFCRCLKKHICLSVKTSMLKRIAKFNVVNKFIYL